MFTDGRRHLNEYEERLLNIEISFRIFNVNVFVLEPGKKPIVFSRRDRFCSKQWCLGEQILQFLIDLILKKLWLHLNV